MEEQIAGDLYVQTYMIVWNVDLNITKKMALIDILTPKFCLKPTGTENENWIRLERFGSKLKIESNFASVKELKKCTTYMINPVTNTVTDVFNGFANHPWNQNEWREKMLFAFELEIQCATSPDPPIIWKRCTTEIVPPINTYARLLNLESQKAEHTVLNNRDVSCTVTRYPEAKRHSLTITPENPSENWNLFTLMLKELKNDVYEWCFIHSTITTAWKGRSYKTFCPLTIIEISELSTSLENMSEFDIAAITSVIKRRNISRLNCKNKIFQPFLPLLKAKSNEITKTQHLLNISSNLIEYFDPKKLCDITVQVEDHKIRAHKFVLATGSTIWRDLFLKDETLANIFVADFDYETIKALINYMYTGSIKQATDQLLIAADKYGVVGLKELCETQLIKTIGMKTVINLLVLADRYNASALNDAVEAYIKEHTAAIMKLEEAKAMFMMYPALAFKLFSNIS